MNPSIHCPPVNVRFYSLLVVQQSAFPSNSMLAVPVAHLFFNCLLLNVRFHSLPGVLPANRLTDSRTFRPAASSFA
ncbi:MAG: hypothetical protein JXA61_05165 [Bacteroidales bacterium]|nr:hypothetical protein [Bacteroidales bacterium]